MFLTPLYVNALCTGICRGCHNFKNVPRWPTAIWQNISNYTCIWVKITGNEVGIWIKSKNYVKSQKFQLVSGVLGGTFLNFANPGRCLCVQYYTKTRPKITWSFDELFCQFEILLKIRSHFWRTENSENCNTYIEFFGWIINSKKGKMFCTTINCNFQSAGNDIIIENEIRSGMLWLLIRIHNWLFLFDEIFTIYRVQANLNS